MMEVFSEKKLVTKTQAATGSVLSKKLLLKISQYLQEKSSLGFSL